MNEWLNRNQNLFFAEGDGGGATDPPVVDPPEEDEELDIEKIEDPKLKAQLTKLQAANKKAIDDAVKASTDKIIADQKIEADKQKEKDRLTAARKAATEANNTVELAKIERDEAQKLRDEAELIKTEAAKEKFEAEKIKIAAKHKLPDGYHKRLLGTTVEELELDAKELAKSQPTHQLANTQGGRQPGATNTSKDVETAARTTVSRIIGGF